MVCFSATSKGAYLLFKSTVMSLNMIYRLWFQYLLQYAVAISHKTLLINIVTTFCGFSLSRLSYLPQLLFPQSLLFRAHFTRGPAFFSCDISQDTFLSKYFITHQLGPFNGFWRRFNNSSADSYFNSRTVFEWFSDSVQFSRIKKFARCLRLIFAMILCNTHLPSCMESDQRLCERENNEKNSNVIVVH